MLEGKGLGIVTNHPSLSRNEGFSQDVGFSVLKQGQSQDNWMAGHLILTSFMKPSWPNEIGTRKLTC